MKKSLPLFSYRYFLFSFAVLLALCLFATRGLWGSPGLLVTYDAEYHAARTANYYLALKQGQIPPRWAPNLNGNFGYPVFLMVYPLPYMLSTPFFMVTRSIEVAVNMVVILSVFLGAVGAWCIGAQSTRKPWVALISGVLYGFAPYVLVNVYVKGAVAESLFLGIVPWVWLALLSLKNQRKIWWQLLFFVSLFGLFLAHHISLMMFVPVIIAWSIFHWRDVLMHFFKIKVRSTWLRENFPMLIVGTLSVLAVMFFWLPLLAEKHFTKVNQSQAVVNYSQDFVQLPQLLWSKWGYGGFEPNTVNEKFTVMVGVSLWVVIAMGVLWLSRKPKNKFSPDLCFWLVTFGTSISLMLPVSKVFWEVFTPLQYIQFPWRLLGLSALSGTMVYVYLEQEVLPSTWKKVLYFSVVCFVAYELVAWAKPVGYFSHNTYYWLEYPLSSASYDELQPIWFDKLQNFRLSDRVEFRPTGKKVFEDQFQLEPHRWGEVQILEWTGSKMVYSLTTQTAGDVLQRTAFFPGWQVKVNGQAVPIKYQDQEFSGRVTFAVPAGKHTIEARFTGRSLDRTIADLLTVLGVLGFLTFLAWEVAVLLSKKH